MSHLPCVDDNMSAVASLPGASRNNPDDIVVSRVWWRWDIWQRQQATYLLPPARSSLLCSGVRNIHILWYFTQKKQATYLLHGFIFPNPASIGVARGITGGRGSTAWSRVQRLQGNWSRIVQTRFKVSYNFDQRAIFLSTLRLLSLVATKSQTAATTLS